MSTLPFSSATERNRQPILDQLIDLLPDAGTVLEIGSGTGQHAVFLPDTWLEFTGNPLTGQKTWPGLNFNSKLRAIHIYLSHYNWMY